MAKVYKVLVSGDDKTYYSLNAKGKYRTAYRQGEVTRRDNIFVFLDPEDTYGFSYGTAWECETTTEPRLSPDYIPDYDYTRENGWLGLAPEEVDKFISSFWDSPYGEEDGGPLSLIEPFEQSYLVDDLKLIRPLEE